MLEISWKLLWLHAVSPLVFLTGFMVEARLCYYFQAELAISSMV